MICLRVTYSGPQPWDMLVAAARSVLSKTIGYVTVGATDNLWPDKQAHCCVQRKGALFAMVMGSCVRAHGQATSRSSCTQKLRRSCASWAAAARWSTWR